MILLVNPRATKPKNRRFPLSVMAIGAVLPSCSTTSTHGSAGPIR
jgi:hypothetical protein